MLPDVAVFDLTEHSGHDTAVRPDGIWCETCGVYVREEAAAALDSL